jgi:hypothetical protein
MRFEATDAASRDAYQAEVEEFLEKQKSVSGTEKNVSGTAKSVSGKKRA